MKTKTPTYFVSLLLVIQIFLISCDQTEKPNSNTFGKYVNNFEKNATHYVILKPDSTYIHYYKFGKLKFENKNKWRTYMNGKLLKVAFFDWESFGFKNENSCNKCFWAVELRNEVLYFSYDTPHEMNFSKE